MNQTLKYKYSHEKLDSRHIAENKKEFNKLPLHLMIAGELEIIEREDITSEEKRARITIAKTLCYHKMYLQDDELRDGYDQMLKKVERGMQGWDPVLGEHLHEYLNYRANVILREKIQKDDQNKEFTKVEHRKSSSDRKNMPEGKGLFIVRIITIGSAGSMTIMKADSPGRR